MGMTLDTSFQILWEFSAFLQKKKDFSELSDCYLFAIYWPRPLPTATTLGKRASRLGAKAITRESKDLMAR